MALDLAEQILGAFSAAITAANITGIGTRIARDREDAFGEDEIPLAEAAVNIKPQDESSRPLGMTSDDNQLNVDLEITVRAAQGEAWTTKANAFAVLVHAALFAYQSWPGFIPVAGDGRPRISRTGRDWGGDKANRTPGKLTVSYAVRYLSSARALDAAPNQP
jgi:hypothetical protein